MKLSLITASLTFIVYLIVFTVYETRKHSKKQKEQEYNQQLQNDYLAKLKVLETRRKGLHKEARNLFRSNQP